MLQEESRLRAYLKFTLFSEGKMNVPDLYSLHSGARQNENLKKSCSLCQQIMAWKIF